MYEDSFDDIVPSTPSPVLNKRFKPLSLKSYKVQTSDKETNDNHALKELNTEDSHEVRNSKFSLAMPGQPGFIQEREEAIRNKKQKEHLSPFKKLSCGNLQKPVINTSSDINSSSACLGGFVKSSSLLDKFPNSSSTVLSHKIKQKRKSTDLIEQFSNRTKERKIGSSSRVRPSTSQACSTFGWPSSSDSSSSDDEELLRRFKVKPIKSLSSSARPSATVTCTANTTPKKHTSTTTLNYLNGEHKLKKHNTCKLLKEKIHSKAFDCNHKTAKTKTSVKSAGQALEAPWYNYMAEPSSAKQSPHVPIDVLSRQNNIPSPIISTAQSPSNTSVTFYTQASTTTPLPSWSGTPNSAEWKNTHKAKVSPNMTESQFSCQDRNETPDVILISDDTGLEDNPIDVDLLTPDTKRAFKQVQQLQSDEEIARKLQEELDREFALSIQSQHEQTEANHVEDTARLFTPPLHSPRRTRGRGRARGGVYGGRAIRNELRDLLQDSENSMIGPDLDFILALSSARRERRGAFSIAGFSGMVESPSASGNDYEFLMNLSEQIGDAKPKGLSKSASNQLPVVSYKKQEDKCEECHICMTEYEDGDSQKILPCFHNYHAKCIDKWIAKNATCPVCRVDVKLE